MKAFHLDPLGGIAGDMFVAAMLNLRPDFEAGLREVLSKCPTLADVDVTVVAHHDGVLIGNRFVVSNGRAASEHHHDYHPPQNHCHRHGEHEGEDRKGAHHHHHHADESHHAHTAWHDIRHMLDALPVSASVTGHAIGIFSELAAAEGRVHGVAPDDVTFHEVGAWDSIADILAAAYLIDAAGDAHWTVGPIPMGSGRVRTAHGLLPVPAPATAILLEGFSFIDDGVPGERITPTGAAILRYLCRGEPRKGTIGQLAGAGHGFGTRRLPGISNCLRILAFERPEEISTDIVAVLECEIDDQTGEDLAIALAHLRSHAGVLDALQFPAFGKKGRMMTGLRILALPATADEVARLIFDETTTIGIRRTLTQRLTLPRHLHATRNAERVIRAKTTTRPSGATTKIEADSLGEIRGHATRERLRHDLANDGDGP